jgi:hypothetical protein
VRRTEPDQILDGRYRLIRVIDSGSFGTVWCAEHLALGSLVAVKVLEAVPLAAEVRQRFMREAPAAASLRSPHVVQMLDCGVDGETPYIVMELLEGESLEQRLARVGCLGVVETERMVRHIARALDRAHGTGIIHRDLKPANIFIQTEDGDELVKVLDFGIAKFETDTVDRSLAGLTPAGVLLGTPHYMSPEQICCEQELDGRTDIWSLGVVAFECLLGRTPFDAESVTAVLAAIIAESPPVPSQLGPVPEGFDEWFARACAPDRTQRYAAVRQAADAFAAFSGGSAVSGGSTDTPAPLRVAVAAHLVKNDAGPPHENGGAKDRAFPPHRRKLSRRRAWSGLLLMAGAASLWVIDVLSVHPDAARLPEPQSGLVEVSVRAQRAVEHSSAALPLASAAAAAGLTPGWGESLPTVYDERTPRREAAADSSTGPLKPAAPVARAPSANSTSRRTRRSAHGATSARQATAPEQDCDPPWYFDERGQPRAKTACL